MWECSAIRSWDKTSGVLARSLLPRFDCDFLLFSHGHGSSRRFEGISLFLSSAHLCAYPLSKAQRQQDPAQNSYELNPQPTTNYEYASNQNPQYGNNHGNGTPDNFYDEVSHPPSSCLSQFSLKPHQSLQKYLCLGLGRPGANQPVQQRRYSYFRTPREVARRC